MTADERDQLFTSFLVIPAIDLKGGQVVRLVQGDLNRATVYSDDPAQAARQFETAGARIIHVVDLDGAVAGEPRNLDALAAIRRAVSCAIDLSGGLRSMPAIERALAAGADFVSLGSVAFLNPELLHAACVRFPRQVFGSLDARGGRLAIGGWLQDSDLTVAQAAARFAEAGVKAITYTDIARDGTQAGADAERFCSLARTLSVGLIASGGVASVGDIVALRRCFDDGVVGVISGRALYEGRFTLEQAIAAAR